MPHRAQPLFGVKYSPETAPHLFQLRPLSFNGGRRSRLRLPKVEIPLYLVRKGAGRKEGTTSSQHGAYVRGNTHPTMAKNNEFSETVMLSKSLKFRLSSD